MMSTVNVQAQESIAAISIGRCDQSSFDVYPGANTTSIVNCTLHNPTEYDEKIELSISNIPDGFTAELVDGNVTVVAAGSSKNFTIEMNATVGMKLTYYVTITATVIEANGSPPPNTSSSNYNVGLLINEYHDYEVSPTNQIISFSFDENNPLDELIEISVTNNGNYNTTFRVGSYMEFSTDLESYNLALIVPLYQSVAENESTFFSIGIGSNSIINTSYMNETALLNFNLASNLIINTSSWTILDNGSKLLTLNTVISIITSTTVSYCYQCNGTSNLTVQIYYVPYEESSESIPGFEGSLSLLSFIFATIIICRRENFS